MKTKLLLLTFLAFAPSAKAQYTVDWSTIDSGGGQSFGGVYMMAGTIGQPDAAVSSGGAYTLQGGFWSFAGDPGLEIIPSLHIRQSGTNVILSWPNPSLNFELQSADNFSMGAWSNVVTAPTVVGSEKEVALPIQPGPQFFRLRRP